MVVYSQASSRIVAPDGLFDDTVVRTLLPEHSTGARRALVHRAVSSGDVLRLKPGLYCLAPPLRRSEPHPFVIAALLCFPSQVSLETALAYHGLIPEAVHQVASYDASTRNVLSSRWVVAIATLPAGEQCPAFDAAGLGLSGRAPTPQPEARTNAEATPADR